MVANPVSKSSVENLSGASLAVAADYSSGDHTFATVTRAIHVNNDGDAVLRFENASSDVTLTLMGGVSYPYRITAVKNSGTTAGMGIFGLY